VKYETLTEEDMKTLHKEDYSDLKAHFQKYRATHAKYD